MAAASFNEQAFELKLSTLKDTQEAINALSQWCILHKEHHKKIVGCWLHCLKRVKVEVRLSLFYLANDVIQYSKRKHLDFTNSWATALQKATPLVRDDKVRIKIQRIFKIWEERAIYDEAFISDLLGLLATSVKKKQDSENVIDNNDFDPGLLVRKIKEIKVLGENTDIKYKRIRDNKLPLTDAERMRLSLKDRRHGRDMVAEVDNGVKKMEAYVKALEAEINSRDKLMDLLRGATSFYEDQRSQVKTVANAYRVFGNRLKSRKKSLMEVMANLPSPVPSPDVNAPSPSPDSDLDASGSQNPPQAVPHSDPNMEFSLVNSSFIGSADFIGLTRNMFSNEPPAPQPATEPQAIQVIGARDTAAAGFDAAEFLKSFMPAKEIVAAPPPPPVQPAFTGWCDSAPWDQPPPDSAKSPPLYEKQVTQPPVYEYDDTIPAAPVLDMDHRTMPELPDVDQRVLTMNVPDVDQRNSIVLHASDVSLPNMVAPPPIPAAVQAVLDFDHRNLISLTGSPSSQVVGNELKPDETSYPLPHNHYAKEDLGFPQPIYPKDESEYDPSSFEPDTVNIYLKEYVPQQITKQEDFLLPGLGSQNSIEHHRSDEVSHRAPWGRDLREADPRVKDNVESIDMDCSEDDEESQRQQGESHMGRSHFGGPMRDERCPPNHSNEPIISTSHLAPPPPPPTFIGSRNAYSGGPPRVRESPQKLPLHERLIALSAGAKLIPPDPPMKQRAEDNNGYNAFDEDFTEDYNPGEYQQHEKQHDYNCREQQQHDEHGDYNCEEEPVYENHEEYYEERVAPIRPMRPRWQAPRGHRGPRPRWPYRGAQRHAAPRFFRPRGRWYD